MQDSWRAKVMFHWGFSVCLRVFPAVHYSSLIHIPILRPPKVCDIITSQQITTSSFLCWDFAPDSDSAGYRVRQLFFSERAFGFSNGWSASEELKLENFCRLTSGFKVPWDVLCITRRRWLALQSAGVDIWDRTLTLNEVPRMFFSRTTLLQNFAVNYSITPCSQISSHSLFITIFQRCFSSVVIALS